MITPAMITIPILLRVSPKPELIESATLPRSMPESRPNPIATKIRARKGCS